MQCVYGGSCWSPDSGPEDKRSGGQDEARQHGLREGSTAGGGPRPHDTLWSVLSGPRGNLEPPMDNAQDGGVDADGRRVLTQRWRGPGFWVLLLRAQPDGYSDPAAVHSVFFESPLFITTIIAGHFNRFCV